LLHDDHQVIAVINSLCTTAELVSTNGGTSDRELVVVARYIRRTLCINDRRLQFCQWISILFRNYCMCWACLLR